MDQFLLILNIIGSYILDYIQWVARTTDSLDLAAPLRMVFFLTLVFGPIIGMLWLPIGRLKL